MRGAPSRPRVRASGDSLLLVELEPRMDAAINARAVSMARTLGAAGLSGVRDVVASYACVGVHVDPLRLDVAAFEQAVARAWDAGPEPEAAGRLVEIPVTYGGPHGPDLEDVAAFARCTPDEVVRRHSDAVYRVYMLGFLPGFAYLGAVDEVIAMPRRQSPRLTVPPGSVGIAGRQTGVYPVESPGGWRLVGRTPWRMFDATRARTSLVEAGDRVRFVPVAAGQWPLLGEGPAA